MKLTCHLVRRIALCQNTPLIIEPTVNLIGQSTPVAVGPTLNITNPLLFLIVFFIISFNKENCSYCGVISLVIEFLIDCCLINEQR